MFDRWDQDHVTYWAYEFPGGPQPGPEHSLIHYPYHGLDGYRTTPEHVQSVNVPPDFSMLGFLLVVNGHLEKTAKSQAAVTCSIGHGTQSQSWPLGIPSRDRDPVTGSDFSLECFTSDYNPTMVGVPPYPPLPPFPVTLSTPKSLAAAGTTPSSPGGGRDVISAST